MAEMQREVIQSDFPDGTWIDILAEVFGKPLYWTTPEEDADGNQDIASYWIEVPETTDALYLTIMRGLLDDEPSFQIDVKNMRDKRQYHSEYFTQVKTITITDKQGIIFSGLDNRTRQPLTWLVTKQGALEQLPSSA